MIYFDNAATTSLLPELLDSYVSFLRDNYGNPSSVNSFGTKTREVLELGRRQIAKQLEASEEEIIFTSGATEANNLAIRGVSLQYQNRGKHLITSSIEHPSVLKVFQALELEGFQVTYLPVDSHGIISLEALKAALDKETILVSIMAVNNETGVIEPLKEVRDILKAYPLCFFHSDVTQAIGKIPLDFKLFDLMSMSAHKIRGIKGSGLLLKRNNVKLVPQLLGGGQESGYRSGTSNVPADLLLAKTIRLAFELMKENYQHAASIYTNILAFLKSHPEYFIVNSFEEYGTPYILNFSLKIHKASVIMEGLSNAGIMVSTKSACSSKKAEPSLTILNMTGDMEVASNSLRLSFSAVNSLEECEIFKTTLLDLLNKTHSR